MEILYIILVVIAVGGLIALWKLTSANLTVGVIGAALSILITVPVYPIWASIAKGSELSYNEFWNGSEVAATYQNITCTRDGSCQNTYSCDPYTVTEMESYTDSNGDRKTRLVTKTKYHSCPYSKQETKYVVNTTLGDYDISGWLMTGEPYDSWTGIPGGQVTTPPAAWSEAEARIRKGHPGGVTKRATYKNYILASDATLFKEYSELIDELKADNMLPTPAKDIHSHYQATKAYFAGVEGVDAPKYVDDVAYLNAPVGSELHGDLHVVFVNADKVSDKTDYTNALKAYWTSKEMGRDAIAKNSIVVVIAVDDWVKPVEAPVTAEGTETGDSAAVDGETAVEAPVEPKKTDSLAPGEKYVAWATMFTGMPVGNEALAVQISSDLAGEPVDGNLIGRPKFTPESGKYKMTDGGKLQSILFGENKFTRVSMTAEHEDDKGSGFAYLANAWEPSAGTMVGISILVSVLAGLAFFGTVVLAFRYERDGDPIRSFISKGTH